MKEEEYQLTAPFMVLRDNAMLYKVYYQCYNEYDVQSYFEYIGNTPNVIRQVPKEALDSMLIDDDTNKNMLFVNGQRIVKTCPDGKQDHFVYTDYDLFHLEQ